MRRAAVVVAGFLAGYAVYQLALVAGAPLGRAAWAGTHTTLPANLRVGSAMAALVYLSPNGSGKREASRGLAETAEAKDLLRSAMQELQAVVVGMRGMSLRREVDSAASVLESAGIAVTTSVSGDELSGEVADAVCWVVREATTNVLRHSGATRCHITLDCSDGRLELQMVNDGVAAPHGSTPRSGGKGIVGMRERMAAVGGSLTSGLDAAGEFVLRTSAQQSVGRVS